LLARVAEQAPLDRAPIVPPKRSAALASKSTSSSHDDPGDGFRCGRTAAVRRRAQL